MNSSLIIILLSLSLVAHKQPGAGGFSCSLVQAEAQKKSGGPCNQPTGEQARIMRKGQKDKYLIRRIEFIGNAMTRDGVLRRRITPLREGKVFTHANLTKSLRNVSKLKMIYPVTLKEVLAQLNDDEKIIDITICFTEKVASRQSETSFEASNRRLQPTPR